MNELIVARVRGDLPGIVGDARVDEQQIERERREPRAQRVHLRGHVDVHLLEMQLTVRRLQQVVQTRALLRVAHGRDDFPAAPQIFARESPAKSARCADD